jgi:hypothetical protein
MTRDHVNVVPPGGPWTLAISWARLQVEYSDVGASNCARQWNAVATGFSQLRRINPTRGYLNYDEGCLRRVGWSNRPPE